MKRKRRRMRLKLHSTVLKVSYDTRPKVYMDLRYWWLHELAQYRAIKRVTGANVKSKMKIAQKELARLRQEYCK